MGRNVTRLRVKVGAGRTGGVGMMGRGPQTVDMARNGDGRFERTENVRDVDRELTRRSRHDSLSNQYDVSTYAVNRAAPGSLVADSWFFKSLRLRLGDGTLDKPYMQHPWVYACIAAIATNIASVPFKLQRSKGSGAGKETVVVEDGPMFELFRDVNPHMTRAQLWEATLIWLSLKGEVFWVLESKRDSRLRPGELPAEIWPICGDYFEPAIGRDSKIVEAWKYTPPSGETVTYLPHELIHLKYYNPYNPFRGLAPLQAALMGIRQDYKASIYNEAFFDNGADPGGILMTDDTMTDPQVKRLRESWDDRHKGPDKRGRTAVLENGMKYVANEAKHKDMEFMGQRKWNREEAMAVFKVPKSELSIYEDLNFATARSQDRGFWQKTLIPKMRYIEDALDSDLFGRLSRSTTRGVVGRFDVSVVEALQEEFKEMLEQAERLFGMGIPFNSINRRLGLGIEEPEWGDVGFLPFNLTPVSDLVEIGGDRGSDTPANEPDAKSFAEASAGLSLGARRKAVSEESLRLWQSFVKRVLDPGEKRFQRKIKSFVFKLRKDQLARLKAHGDKAMRDGEIRAPLKSGDIDAVLFIEKEWRSTLVKMVHPVYGFIGDRSIKALEQELGQTVTFTMSDPAAVKFLKRKELKVSDVVKRVRQGLKRELQAGVANGETIAELQDRIRRELNFTSGRSLTIARTESAQMANGVRHRAIKKEKFEEHTWITAGDENVRPSHEAQDGTSARVGEEFPNGLEYPGDVDGEAEEVINCRCIAVPVV